MGPGNVSGKGQPRKRRSRLSHLSEVKELEESQIRGRCQALKSTGVVCRPEHAAGSRLRKARRPKDWHGTVKRKVGSRDRARRRGEGSAEFESKTRKLSVKTRETGPTARFGDAVKSKVDRGSRQT